MNLHQGNKRTEDASSFPVLTDVVKQFFHQFARQPNNSNGESSIQVTNKFDTNLQDINDDCLLEIFSLKFLDPMDLCSLAETCTRFEQITRIVFPTKFTECPGVAVAFRLEGKSNIFEVRVENEWNSIRSKAKVFENFGSCLSEVSIINQDVLNLVAMYCSDKLKSLKMRSMKITEELTVQLKPIFKHLQKLDIFNVRFDTDLFANCDSLIELHVSCCGADILQNTFPKLERFGFRHDSFYSLSSFISRHKGLKTVTIFMGDGTTHRMYDNLRMLSRNCLELEELKIDIWELSNFPDLQNLGRLKKLTICVESGHGMQCIHQLQSLKSLETLKLPTMIGDNFELFEALSQLKKLRKLHLYSYSGDPTFINQLALLSQLKKLHIYWLEGGIGEILNIIRLIVSLETLQLDDIRNGLTKEDFSEIVNLVKRRSNALTLKCKIVFSYDLINCGENQKLKFVPR